LLSLGAEQRFGGDAASPKEVSATTSAGLFLATYEDSRKYFQALAASTTG